MCQKIHLFGNVSMYSTTEAYNRMINTTEAMKQQLLFPHASVTKLEVKNTTPM